MNTQPNIRNIAFAGSGNVAWHLAQVFYRNGYKISGIWSRDVMHATALAESCNSIVCDAISGLKEGADLIIIAVPDMAIDFIAENIGNFDRIVVHTAGSVPIDILKTYFDHYGSLYPLQTFSKEIAVSTGDIPFFAEASDNATLNSIKQVALTISQKVYEADSHKRLLLHIAAVFAGNYSNLMYVISKNLLNNVDLPEDILHPLILETARKAVNGDPILLQTGPARRKDKLTIEKHIEALAPLPEYAELYKLLSQIIIKQYE